MAARPLCPGVLRHNGLRLLSRSTRSPVPISHTSTSCLRCSSRARRVLLWTCVIFVTLPHRVHTTAPVCLLAETAGVAVAFTGVRETTTVLRLLADTQIH